MSPQSRCCSRSRLVMMMMMMQYFIAKAEGILNDFASRRLVPSQRLDLAMVRHSNSKSSHPVNELCVFLGCFEAALKIRHREVFCSANLKGTHRALGSYARTSPAEPCSTDNRSVAAADQTRLLLAPNGQLLGNRLDSCSANARRAGVRRATPEIPHERWVLRQSTVGTSERITVYAICMALEVTGTCRTRSQPNPGFAMAKAECTQGTLLGCSMVVRPCAFMYFALGPLGAYTQALRRESQYIPDGNCSNHGGQGRHFVISFREQWNTSPYLWVSSM